jgi:hypothetical protein
MAVTIISSKTEEIQNLLKQLSTCIGSPPDPTTLEITKDKKVRIMETFKISNEEIETLTENNSKDPIVDLIIERVALLATQL